MPDWIGTLQASTQPAYLAVVDAIRSGIASGGLSPGERLPTHRELADHLGVARGTVMRAYQEAERLGLVRGQVGRGTFVHATGGENPLARSTERLDDGIVDLSANRPLQHLDPPLRAVLRELSGEESTDRLSRYVDISGVARHVGVGAKWLERWGVSATSAGVFVCAGAQHAVFTSLLSMSTAGDLIAAEGLTYPSLKPIAETLGLRLVGLGMDEHGLKPEAFAAMCSQRKVRALYTVPTIQNPTGTVLDEARRREIAAIARQHDVWIIEDDIHRLYHMRPPATVQSMAPERTVFIAATSKCVMGGLRVAFVSCPDRLRDQFRRGVLSTVWNAAPLMAEIACRWIVDGTAEATITRKREESLARWAIAKRVLHDATLRGFEGGLSVWLELGDGWRSADFALQTQRHSVLVSHDEVFAVGVPCRAGRGHVRVSLSAPESREVLARGLETLAMVLRRGASGGAASH